MHGEEEIRMVLHDGFQFQEDEGTEFNQNAGFELEERDLIMIRVTIAKLAYLPIIAIPRTLIPGPRGHPPGQHQCRSCANEQC